MKPCRAEGMGNKLVSHGGMKMQEKESGGVCVAGQGGKRGLRGQKREQWTALSRDPCYKKTAVFNS